MTFRSVLKGVLGAARTPLFLAVFSYASVLPLLGVVFGISEEWKSRTWIVLGGMGMLYGFPVLIYLLARRYQDSRLCIRTVATLLTALLVTGLALSALLGKLSDLRNFLIVLAASAAAIFGFVYTKQRREEVLARAESKGWNLSPKEQSDLEFDVLLLRNMTPRQRVLFNVMLAAAVFTVCIVFFVLCAFDKHYVLGGWFMVVVISVTMYFYRILSKEFVKKNQLANELQTARQMQISLMPAADPKTEGLDIAGISVPAEEVGGDLYDYFEPVGLPGTIGIAVADVSGKAMKAAIATVLVSGMLRSEYGRTGVPSDILRNVNHSLRGGLEAHGFVAMQILTLAPREMIAHYTNAGQVYPLLRRGGEIQYFGGSALPLGIAGEAEFKDASVSLEAGDVLLLVSDGITEAMNERRELFGFERLETTLLGLPSGLSARAMLDSVLSQVRAFAGKAKQHDDITLVVVKVL